MKKKILYLALSALVFLGFIIFNIRVKAEHFLNDEEIEVFLNDFMPKVDETLMAYNDESYRNFYKYYAKRRLAKTESIFKATWVNGYKREYGDLLAKTLIKDKCNFNKINPLLYYIAEFEKTKNSEIKVIFIKEKGEYKIFHIRFDPTGKDYEEYWNKRSVGTKK